MPPPRPEQLPGSYVSFSGADALALFLFPGAAPVLVGSLRALSYSILRPKHPVYTLGRHHVTGFAYGHRVVGGTLIFNALLDRHWLRRVQEQVPYLQKAGPIMADELPPFTILVVVANEYSSAGSFQIHGVRLVDESQVTAVEDLFTENTVTFQAQSIDLMQPAGGWRNVQQAPVARPDTSSNFAGRVLGAMIGSGGS